MDYFNSEKMPDQDREPQFDVLKPKPLPPNTGQWANIVITIVVIAVIAGGVFWGYRWVKQLSDTVKVNSPEVVEATWSVSTANDGMVREASHEVPLEDLIARPEEFTGRWLFTDATIVWLMDQETGDPVTLEEAQTTDNCIYWLEGPLVVKDHRDTKPAAGPGAMLRPWGKLVEVPADKMGLSAAGLEKLEAMDGYNGTTVLMIIARFVEVP